MMAYFPSRWKFATLVRPEKCAAGFVRSEDEKEVIPASRFEGKTGEVVEIYDSGYDVRYPTGYEPCYALVDFDGQRVWIVEAALKFFGQIS